MIAQAQEPRPLESTTAARELQLSVSRLHQLADKLDPPVLRTTSGRRLFYVEDLERIRRERAARRSGSPLDAA